MKTLEYNNVNYEVTASRMAVLLAYGLVRETAPDFYTLVSWEELNADPDAPQGASQIMEVVHTLLNLTED